MFIANDLIDLVELAFLINILDDCCLGRLSKFYIFALEHLGLAYELEEYGFDVDQDKFIAVLKRDGG